MPLFVADRGSNKFSLKITLGEVVWGQFSRSCTPPPVAMYPPAHPRPQRDDHVLRGAARGGQPQGPRRRPGATEGGERVRGSDFLSEGQGLALCYFYGSQIFFCRYLVFFSSPAPPLERESGFLFFTPPSPRVVGRHSKRLGLSLSARAEKRD